MSWSNIDNRNGASSCAFIQKKMGVDHGHINHHVVENTTIKLLGGPLRGKLSNASDFDLSFTEIA